MKQTLNKYYPIAAGTFAFLLMALYNGYPIVNGDTAAYINSGFTMEVPETRPIFYGLFLRCTSLGASLWGTIAVQALIVSYLCTRFIKAVAGDIENTHIVALLLCVATATIGGWYTGQLMPDAFTPVLFLAVWLYMMQPGNRMQQVILLMLILISILVHVSHYVIATLLSLLLLAASFIPRYSWMATRRKAITLLSTTIIAWMALLTSNYMGGRGFRASASSHVFLMGKLAESGVLRTYLEKACPTRDYKICAYKDNLPHVAWGFVWDQASPVSKTGGWEANREEYSTIIRDIASRPKYWPFLAYKSIEATSRQIVLSNIDESEELSWLVYDKDNPVYKAVERYFPHEISEFAVVRQNQKTLNIPFYDDVYVVFLLITFVAVMLLTGKDTKTEVGRVYLYLLLFLLLNAFVTATFANVSTRLNSRCIWLLPLVNVALLYSIVKQRWGKHTNAE